MGIDRTRSRSSAAPAAGGGTYQSGAAVAASSIRSSASGSAWNPTITNLMVLIVLEIAAFAALRYAFGVVSKSI